MSKKVQSWTTPGHKMQIRSWLAELVLLRRFGKLPPHFWRSPKWKNAYGREVKAISKFIKAYGECAVVSVSCDKSLVTFTDYAKIEYFIQKEKASIDKLKAPKDITEVTNEETFADDLREPRCFIKKKTLFERLAEIENG